VNSPRPHHPPQAEHELSFIHRFVRGTGANASTTLLLLHGTGGNESDLLELGGMLLSGATLLSPRGKVLEHGMPRFFHRLAEGVFDVDDLIHRTHELANFVAEACAAYALDANRVIAVGYSNGANIAAGMLFLRPETLQAAILFRPMVPLEPAQLPNLSGKHLLIARGLHDPIIDPANTRRLIELFSIAGASVEVHDHPGGHELDQDDLVAAGALINQWNMKGTTTSVN